MKILFVTAKSDSPSARWRVHQLLPYFEKEGIGCTAEEVPAGMFAKLSLCKKAADFDLVVLQKRLLPKLVFHRLRKFAKKLVFEYDDNVMQKRSEDGGVRTPSTRERRFRRTVRGADAIFTTNDVLAGLARNAVDDPTRVHVFPSVIDLPRYSVRPPAVREGPLTLGWMGTKSNLHYLEVVRQPLARLCRRVDGLQLKVVCEEALELEGVRIEPKTFAAAEEVRDLQSFDIAIAPLVEDPWTRGKISTKILAYFAAGLPVVASDVASNRLYVKNGENAWLAGTLSAWEERLEQLLANPDQRDALGAAARQCVEREFSIGAVVPRYLDLFRSLAR